MASPSPHAQHIISTAVVSFLVGCALGALGAVSRYDARLSVLEEMKPQVHAIYAALIRQGIVRPNIDSN